MSKSMDLIQCSATMPMGLPEVSRTTAMGRERIVRRQQLGGSPSMLRRPSGS